MAPFSLPGVNARHVRLLSAVVVDPDVQVTERGDNERTLGRQRDGKRPEEQERVGVHRIVREPEDPLSDQRQAQIERRSPSQPDMFQLSPDA